MAQRGGAPREYTYEELIQMGAKPTSTPAAIPPPRGKAPREMTYEEAVRAGGKPQGAAPSRDIPGPLTDARQKALKAGPQPLPPPDLIRQQRAHPNAQELGLPAGTPVVGQSFLHRVEDAASGVAKGLFGTPQLYKQEFGQVSAPAAVTKEADPNTGAGMASRQAANTIEGLANLGVAPVNLAAAAATHPIDTALALPGGIATSIGKVATGPYDAVGGMMEGDFDRASQGGVDALEGALAFGGGYEMAKGGLARLEPSAESLQLKANALRNAGASAPTPNVPMSTTGAAVNLVKAVARPALNAGASVLERGARGLARLEEPAPLNLPRPTGATTLPFESPSEPIYEPRLPAPARPAEPIRGFNPPDETYSPKLPEPMKPAEPLPYTPGPERFDPANAPTLEFRPRPTGPSEPIPYTGAPLESGQAVKVRTPKEIEQSIAPSGRFAKQSTMRNVPRLLEELPELAKVAPEQFDSALMDGFKGKEAAVIAEENAVPRSTIVKNGPIIEGLERIAADYAERGLDKSAAKINRIIESWKELGDDIPWEQFRDRKRAFFGESSIMDSPLRKAYGVLMDAASTAGEGLARANKSYSVVRRALENAGIDLVTGRRIMEVGKATKKTPFRAAKERMFRAPL